MTDTDTKQIVAINRCQIRKVYCVKINRLTKTMDVNDKDYEGKSQPNQTLCTSAHRDSFSLVACPPNTQNRTLNYCSVDYKRKAGYLASARSPF